MTEIRVSINNRTLDTLNVPDEALFVESWQDLVSKVNPEFYQEASEDHYDYSFQDIQEIIDGGGNNDGSVTATDFTNIERKLNSIEYQSFIRILSVSRFFSDTGSEQSFVKKFIQQGYPITAIHYASGAAKDDMDLALLAVANNAWSLQFFSDRIRSDQLVGLRALENNRDAWSSFALGSARDEESLRETCLVGWSDSMNVDGVSPPEFAVTDTASECNAPQFNFYPNSPTISQTHVSRQYVTNMNGVNIGGYGSDFVRAVKVARTVSGQYSDFISGYERKVLGGTSEDDLSEIPSKWLDIYLQTQTGMVAQMGAGAYGAFIHGVGPDGQNVITVEHMKQYAGLDENSGLFESCARGLIGVTPEEFNQNWHDFTESSYFNTFDYRYGSDDYHMEVFANGSSPFFSVRITKNGLYSHVIDSDVINPSFVDQKAESLTALIDMSLTVSDMSGSVDHRNFTQEELFALMNVLREKCESDILERTFTETVIMD